MPARTAKPSQPDLPQSHLAESNVSQPDVPEPKPSEPDDSRPDPSQTNTPRPGASWPHLSRQRVALAFGAALRKARAGRHLSQEKLAAKGHFDRTYPSLLERGLRTPTLTVVFALAEALEVHPLELVNETVAHLQSDQATERTMCANSPELTGGGH